MMEFEYLINQIRSNKQILSLFDLRTRLLSINMTSQIIVVPDKDDDYKVSLKYKVDTRTATMVSEIDKQILAYSEITIRKAIEHGYPKVLGEKFLNYLQDTAFTTKPTDNIVLI